MNYEPRSLNPNIMEKRINELEKASGGGGFELPIASAETLGGIKVPADSGITIDGSGNAYVPKPISYSMDEIATAKKWIDGRPIFTRVINYTGPLSNTAVTLASDIDYIDNIIDAICVADNVAEGFSPIVVWLDNTNLMGRTAGNYQSQLLHIVIEYVKPVEPEEPTEPTE